MATESILESSRLIAQKKLKIAFAESATAGWLGSEFSFVPESGQIFLGGIVCYNVGIKESLFEIPKEVIEKYTAESAEVTQMLAERLPKFFKSDISVAITGLTSPGGSETPEKPVGTMFIYIKLQDKKYSSHQEVFEGNPKEIISQTIHKVGMMLKELLESYHPDEE